MHTPALPCPTLIGRTEALATLHLLVDRAGKGQGGVALISGEAGIGKSRLVAEVKSYAASHDFLLVQGSCFPTDHVIPYAPLLDLLRSHISRHPIAMPAPEVQQVVQAFLPLLPDVAHVLSDGSSVPLLPPLDREQEKRRCFEILAHFLTAQAVQPPVFLIIEDLHWSDDTSLEFLHYLARRCTTHRLLLLLTYRSDEVRPNLRHFLAQLDRERLTQEILLDRLTRDEVEAMLRAIFALPRSLRLELPDLIYTLTEGNPFFVEEILKSLIASGEIYYADGRWERKELRELHLPRSVQDAVQQRTDQLSQAAQRVLMLAAVAGRRFDFALLQVLTKHDEDYLLTLIKELMAAQLVIEESAEQFAFRHALTRQAIYADLLVRERKALHRTVAETMERLYRSTLDAHLADLAAHFYEAGAWEQALVYGQRAGEKAQAMYAPHAATFQLTRALDAANYLGRMAAPKIYLARGQAYETLGEFEQARSDYERALEIARSVHDSSAEWQGLIALGFLWAGRDYAQTGTYYQRALELARGRGDPLTLAHSLNHLGNWYVNVEQPGEGLRYHQEALATFQALNDQHGKASTLDLLGLASSLNGDLLQGVSYYQQAAALFEQLNDRKSLASTLATLVGSCGSALYWTETLAPAITSFTQLLPYSEQALTIAREIGQRSSEAYAISMLAMCRGISGEFALGLELMQESLQIAEEIGHHQWLISGHLCLGWLYLDLLSLPEARQHLEVALALAHEMGSTFWTCHASAALALVHLGQQDVTGAESILGAAPGPDAPKRTIGQRIIWYARAELALARGDPDLALQIIDQLIASSGNLPGGQSIPRLSKLRGEALVALQRAAEAEIELHAAQEAARVLGWRPLLWRICVTQGRLYQTQARRVEAEHACSTARALIEELAANVPDEQLREHFLSQATAMLPKPRLLTPGRAARQAYGGLTAREREVATLIAQGKSNRDIAEQLVVGNRTVEAHVSSILSKLGFTSRAQIAVWVHEKDLTHTRE